MSSYDSNTRDPNHQWSSEENVIAAAESRPTTFGEQTSHTDHSDLHPAMDTSETLAQPPQTDKSAFQTGHGRSTPEDDQLHDDSQAGQSWMRSSATNLGKSKLFESIRKGLNIDDSTRLASTQTPHPPLSTTSSSEIYSLLASPTMRQAQDTAKYFRPKTQQPSDTTSIASSKLHDPQAMHRYRLPFDNRLPMQSILPMSTPSQIQTPTSTNQDFTENPPSTSHMTYEALAGLKNPDISVSSSEARETPTMGYDAGPQIRGPYSSQRHHEPWRESAPGLTLLSRSLYSGTSDAGRSQNDSLFSNENTFRRTFDTPEGALSGPPVPGNSAFQSCSSRLMRRMAEESSGIPAPTLTSHAFDEDENSPLYMALQGRPSSLSLGSLNAANWAGRPNVGAATDIRGQDTSLATMSRQIPGSDLTAGRTEARPMLEPSIDENAPTTAGSQASETFLSSTYLAQQPLRATPMQHQTVSQQSLSHMRSGTSAFAPGDRADVTTSAQPNAQGDLTTSMPREQRQGTVQEQMLLIQRMREGHGDTSILASRRAMNASVPSTSFTSTNRTSSPSTETSLSGQNTQIEDEQKVGETQNSTLESFDNQLDGTRKTALPPALQRLAPPGLVVEPSSSPWLSQHLAGPAMYNAFNPLAFRQPLTAPNVEASHLLGNGAQDRANNAWPNQTFEGEHQNISECTRGSQLSALSTLSLASFGNTHYTVGDGSILPPFSASSIPSQTESLERKPLGMHMRGPPLGDSIARSQSSRIPHMLATTTPLPNAFQEDHKDRNESSPQIQGDQVGLPHPTSTSMFGRSFPIGFDSGPPLGYQCDLGAISARVGAEDYYPQTQLNAQDPLQLLKARAIGKHARSSSSNYSIENSPIIQDDELQFQNFQALSPPHTYLDNEIDEMHQFFIQRYRTAMCPLFFQHVCPFSRPYTCLQAHNPMQIRRVPRARTPELITHEGDQGQGKSTTWNYSATPCSLSGSLLTCPRGSTCPFSHRVQKEAVFHPTVYKTQRCDSIATSPCATCSRPYIQQAQATPNRKKSTTGLHWIAVEAESGTEVTLSPGCEAFFPKVKPTGCVAYGWACTKAHCSCELRRPQYVVGGSVFDSPARRQTPTLEEAERGLDTSSTPQAQRSVNLRSSRPQDAMPLTMRAGDSDGHYGARHFAGMSPPFIASKDTTPRGGMDLKGKKKPRGDLTPGQSPLLKSGFHTGSPLRGVSALTSLLDAQLHIGTTAEGELGRHDVTGLVPRRSPSPSPELLPEIGSPHDSRLDSAARSLLRFGATGSAARHTPNEPSSQKAEMKSASPLQPHHREQRQSVEHRDESPFALLIPGQLLFLPPNVFPQHHQDSQPTKDDIEQPHVISMSERLQMAQRNSRDEDENNPVGSDEGTETETKTQNVAELSPNTSGEAIEEWSTFELKPITLSELIRPLATSIISRKTKDGSDTTVEHVIQEWVTVTQRLLQNTAPVGTSQEAKQQHHTTEIGGIEVPVSLALLLSETVPTRAPFLNGTESGDLEALLRAQGDEPLPAAAIGRERLYFSFVAPATERTAEHAYYMYNYKVRPCGSSQCVRLETSTPLVPAMKVHPPPLTNLSMKGTEADTTASPQSKTLSISLSASLSSSPYISPPRHEATASPTERAVSSSRHCQCDGLGWHRQDERRRGPFIGYEATCCVQIRHSGQSTWGNPNRGCPLVHTPATWDGEARLPVRSGTPPTPTAGTLPRWSRCHRAHTLMELMYHVAVYKTALCAHFDENDPSTWVCPWRRRCAHAHGVADLRSREQAQREWHVHKALVLALCRELREIRQGRLANVESFPKPNTSSGDGLTSNMVIRDMCDLELSLYAAEEVLLRDESLSAHSCGAHTDQSLSTQTPSRRVASPSRTQQQSRQLQPAKPNSAIARRWSQMQSSSPSSSMAQAVAGSSMSRNIDSKPSHS